MLYTLLLEIVNAQWSGTSQGILTIFTFGKHVAGDGSSTDEDQMKPNMEFKGGTDRMSDYKTSIIQLQKQLVELKGSLKMSATEGECWSLL